jgi:hypothetical protein
MANSPARSLGENSFSDTSTGGGRGRANTMSATTILRDIAQAVGNGFLIFGKILPGMVDDEQREEAGEGLGHCW